MHCSRSPARPISFLLPPILVAVGCAANGTDAGRDTVEDAIPRDGYSVRSDDGLSELEIGGLLQTTLGVYGSEREPSSNFDLKRMRPELSGVVAGAVRFNLEPNFREDGVELEEAWIGLELAGGDALAMAGRMKAPFGLEEVRSRRHIDFPRFSLLNQFSPAEGHGIFVNGESLSGRVEYGVALYNGTGGADTNGGKDVAARLMLHPFAGDASSPWRNLQLGLGATWGREDEDVGDTAIENELGLPVITFAPGVALDGRRWRLGPEAAWFHGPWFAQGELLAQAQEMSGGAGSEDLAVRGGYLTVARVLTGESKSFKGVSPEQPYDFRTGVGTGAWVLALRLSELRLDDDAAGDLFTPGAFTDRIRSVALGLNWIANDHMILRNALVYSAYADSVLLDSGMADREIGFLTELQLHF